MWSVAKYFCNGILGTVYCCLSNQQMINITLTCLVSIHIVGQPTLNYESDLWDLTKHLNILIHVLDYLPSIVYSFFDIIPWLLLNANDVHTNPGPVLENMTHELCISHINAQSLLSEISPNPVPYFQKIC